MLDVISNELKISEIAEILGLTSQGVRYYEKRGIIDTKRDKVNNRRSFTTENLIVLKQVHLYRRFGFSIDEACELVNAPVDTIVEKLSERIAAMENEIITQQQTIGIMRETSATFQQASEQVNSFVFTEMPAFYFMPFHVDGESAAKKKKRQLLLKMWLEHFPAVKYTNISISDNAGGCEFKHDFGLGVYVRDCMTWNPLQEQENLEFVRQYPAQVSVHSLMADSDIENSYAAAADFAYENGRQLIGTVVLLCGLCTVQEKFTSYHKLYFPCDKPKRRRPSTVQRERERD